MKIRTITDPLELARAMLEEVQRGNAEMRETIKEARRVLAGGLAEESRLKAEIKSLNGNRKEGK